MTHPMPFDDDNRDADYRRDPERPRVKVQSEEQPRAMRLVGAEREEFLALNQKEGRNA